MSSHNRDVVAHDLGLLLLLEHIGVVASARARRDNGTSRSATIATHVVADRTLHLIVGSSHLTVALLHHHGAWARHHHRARARHATTTCGMTQVRKSRELA